MNEEVKDAVVEETEVATAEAEVAEATEEKTEDTVAADEITNADEDELSPWYYFFSSGCGWCKKASPVVEELNSDGYDILMLDVAEPDNQKLETELFEEYNTRCGTPFFINADTGKSICGFREKDVLEKWLAGEDIPAPPRPTGPPPKVPFIGASKKEESTYTESMDKWIKDNDHMPDDWKKAQKSAKDLLNAPRPKSDPPRPPMGQDLGQATDAVLEKWGVDMGVWQEENKHLPNMQPTSNLVAQIKSRRDQLAGKVDAVNTVSPSVNNTQLNSMDARVQALEVKIDKLMSHFGVK